MRRGQRIVSWFRRGDYFFAWPVANAGYQVWDEQNLAPRELQSEAVRDEDLIPPFLVEIPSGGWRHSGPLVDRKSTQLHRQLAKLADAPSQEQAQREILEFARCNGFLGRLTVVLVPPPDMEATFFLRGEPFVVWERETQRLRGLVAWWDAARSPHGTDAEQYIAWRRTGVECVEVYWSPDGRAGPSPAAVLASESERPDLLRQWRIHNGFDYAGALRRAVVNFVNEALADHVWLNVAPTYDGYLLAPDSLLGAAYLRFANEVLGSAPAVDSRALCPECGRHYLRRHGRQRFCGDRCRKNHWERRNQPQRAQRKKTGGSDAKAPRST